MKSKIMDSKIDFCMKLIYKAAINMVKAEIEPEEIARELLTSHRSELKLYDVPPEMQLVFLECIAEGIWYAVHGESFKKI